MTSKGGKNVGTGLAAGERAQTRIRQVPERGVYDAQRIEAILDQGLVCHVGIEIDGQPYVIPMAYARVGKAILLHGSRKSRLMQQLATGCRASVAVTLLDGVVLARSHFHHSLNYRSVVLVGRARQIIDPAEKRMALHALVEHLVPGRAAGSREPSDQELAATEILEFPLSGASAKVRTGPPKDPAVDLALDVWAGVVPLTMTSGPPVPAPDLTPERPIPDHVRDYEPGRHG